MAIAFAIYGVKEQWEDCCGVSRLTQIPPSPPSAESFISIKRLLQLKQTRLLTRRREEAE